ncbi:juvenile hormone acid O-methyltransferase-like [Ptychodera flava]|uniref:juvenile hormone acid O-methyltransferase-like n=1 Tax=Ptychodera flava TaxID=63121 RepID=UPI00396A6CAB
MNKIYYSRVKGHFATIYAISVRAMEEISKALPLDQKDVLLDVGCGSGILTTLLSKRVGRVTAFDISPEMIKEAKKSCQAENISYSVGDATQLSTFKEYSNSFDKAVAYFALNWMKDSKTALEGIHQSLKPGGQCFVNMTQQNPDVIDIARIIGCFTNPKWDIFMKGYEHSYYPFKGSVGDFKQMMAGIGFEDIECTQDVFKFAMEDDEGKAFLPSLIGQLGRFPEDRREEYVKEALKFVFDTYQGEYCLTASRITAAARKI